MLAFELTLRASDEELATALLWEYGTTGIEVREADSGLVVLLAYFEEEAGLEGEIRTVLQTVGGVQIREVAVPEVDWVARFREGFRAFHAGGFQVVPVWEGGTPGEGVLIVDPGRAFGTGTHETTRLCLSAIEAIAERGALGHVLDVGTGTGLLAVAAARRGADRVVGVDNDPEAVRSAAQHAGLNAVRLHLVQGDGARPFAPACFEVVLANLTAPLLLAQRDALAAVVRPRGTVVLSGLLLDDVAAVRAAYDGLGPSTVTTDGEWASLVLEAGR